MGQRRNPKHLPDLPAARGTDHRLAHPPQSQTRSLPRNHPQPAMAHHPNSSHQPTTPHQPRTRPHHHRLGHQPRLEPPKTRPPPKNPATATNRPKTPTPEAPTRPTTPNTTTQHTNTANSPNPIISRLLEPPVRNERSLPVHCPQPGCHHRPRWNKTISQQPNPPLRQQIGATSTVSQSPPHRHTATPVFGSQQD